MREPWMKPSITAMDPAAPSTVRMNPENAVIGSRSPGQPSGLGAGEVVVSNEATDKDFTRPALPEGATGP
jgi:hypothetical protein